MRELSAADVVLQAKAFRAFAGRCGLPLAEAFRRWAGSKGLTVADREAVRAEVRRLGVAGAVAAFLEHEAQP